MKTKGMKNKWAQTPRKGTLLATALLVAGSLVSTQVLAADPIVNGSFETGDYTGWTLYEGLPGSNAPSCGVWGIGTDGQVINQGDTTFDYFDGVNVVHSFTTDAFPLTLTATDGNFVAYQLQNCTQTHRMWQEITLCSGATELQWDMQYQSNVPFLSRSANPNFAQELAVEIQDSTGSVVLATLFTTNPGDPLSAPLQAYSADISAFAGQTVRLHVDLQVNSNPLATYVDNFRIPSCDNSPPIANDDEYSTPEDTALNVPAPGVLANDVDPDGDPISAVLDSPTSHGSVTLNADGSFNYVPDANYCGPDSFTYYATEGDGLLWTTHGDGTRLGTIDTADATEIDIGDQGVTQSWAAAFDTDGELFGTYNGFSGNAQLAILDKGTGAVASTIGGLGVNLIALEVDSAGQLWGVGYNNRILYRIDKSTATLAPVGDTGVSATMDLAFAPDGTLYSTVGNVLYELDTVTGAVITSTAISGILSGAVMGMSFDGTGRLFATAYVADSPLYEIDPLTGTAAVVGPTSFFRPHGGDILGSGLSSNIATVSIDVECVNDPPVITNVSPAAQTSDYSDYIGQVVIEAYDIDDTSLTLGQTGAPSAIPNPDLNTTTVCVVVPNDSIEDGSVCSWTMDGQVLAPGDNVYPIVFTAYDEGPSSNSGLHTLTVESEDATVTLDAGNPVAVPVEEEGGDSIPFVMHFTAVETLPDLAGIGTPEHGDLSLMVPYMELKPVGPGGSVPADACVLLEVNPPLPSAYDQVAYFECEFSVVPVNTYEVLAWVDGATDTTRYYNGSDDGVLVVYDPSLGFTTGGGWFYWPGTADPDLLTCGEDGYPGDKTNFGYNMKYNKKMTNVQGSLLLQRHTVDENCEGAGKYRVKSNALQGLSIGDATDATGDYGWAAFSGKSTFRAPGEEESEGNHPFLVYVEDHGDQGGNQDPADEFWIEVQDKDGNVVLEVNGPDSDPAGEDGADGDDTPIENGNIVVPH